MKSRIKGKSTRIPNPLDQEVHKTEPSAVAVLMHWMRNIIEEKNLDLGMPDVETIGSDRKRPDTVIYESHGGKPKKLTIPRFLLSSKFLRNTHFQRLKI